MCHIPRLSSDYMFELMAIQNNPQQAELYEAAGIDRIFIDLEQIGKQARQKNINAVFNTHSIEDISSVTAVLSTAKCLVRVNPIHPQSQDEINQVIDAGADIVMLPMFRTLAEVTTFLNCVSGRAKTMLLFETADSICLLSEICKMPEVDEIYVGLNDMHLSLKMSFLFEPLVHGVVDLFSTFSKAHNKSFGFGGMATLDGGLIPGKQILAEHVRLGSDRVILSRAFFADADLTLTHLKKMVEDIRHLHHDYSTNKIPSFFEDNQQSLREKVTQIIRR